MRRRFFTGRALASVLMSALSLFMLASGLAGAVATTASAASQAASPGWIRLAHFSPNTPAVDVYLYSFDGHHAMIVLHHVSYGTVSPYETLAAGEYTVAMRAAGASSSSPPVLSTSVHVASGGAYTVAGMGPAKGLRLQILTTRLTTPPGKSLVRVIQASLRHSKITVKAGRTVLARDLEFAHVTSYVTTPPGTWHVHVVGMGASGARNVGLAAGTIHTLVVLDATGGGLRIADLEDAAGSGVLPRGGAATGLGGTAPAPSPSPVRWLSVAACGALLAGAGAYRTRRVRRVARHAR
jgi:hypothetical protein